MFCGVNCTTMEKKWYIVQVYANFEKKVAEALRERAAALGLGDAFGEILVPSEKVVNVRRGRKIDVDRKFFPGYILVEMELSDAAFHLVKNIPKVSGFLGGDQEPTPVSQAEVQRIKNLTEEGRDTRKSSLSFEVGEAVRVIDGPFLSFNGLVEEVDKERERLKVSVSIFGRATPVELEYNQVERTD